MEKFELVMMKISKVFGLVLMSVTLALICVFLLILLVGFGAKFFARSTPSVSFDRSHFVESPREQAVSDVNRMSGNERMNFLAESGAKRLAPMYEARVDDYMEREKENLFKDAETRADDMAKYKKTKTDNFVDNTRRVFYGFIGELPRKYEEPYIDDVVDYIKDAEKAGIETLTEQKTPVASLYNSKVLKKFNEEFRLQMREIDGRSSGGFFLMSMAGYGTVMGLIFTFLMLSVMFAIIRIEKKMKG
ncbi:MAG: hypothetical protein KBA61_06545 [Spirochaetes bacterium]|jgi:hypothetical protein|nr:hypothetical protein [Spirochaetota bacterium]